MPLLRKHQQHRVSGNADAGGHFPSASPSSPSAAPAAGFSPSSPSTLTPSSPPSPRASFPATPSSASVSAHTQSPIHTRGYTYTAPAPSKSPFQAATPPSAYISSENVRHHSGAGGGHYNEMFDPFSNAPRPRRKPYSPFSAFEVKTTTSSSTAMAIATTEEAKMEGGERPRPMSEMSTASAYSFEAASASVHSSVQLPTETHHMHTHMHGMGAEGRHRHRKSGLSFEIGGDDTDTDREVPVLQPAPVVIPTQSCQHGHGHEHEHDHHSHIHSHSHSHSQAQNQGQGHGQGEFLAPGRRSTGDSSQENVTTEQEVEPDSSASASNNERDPEPEPESHNHNNDIDEIEDADADADPADLAPPRPRFLRDGGANASRTSWSSQDSSLYPSGPNSDTELMNGGATSDSDREAVVRNDVNTNRNPAAAVYGQGRGRAARERANTAGGASYTQRQHAYKRRSGLYSSVSNVPPPTAATAAVGANGGGRSLPPGAAPPTHMQPTPAQARPGTSPHPSTRRYSGGAHRRSSSSANTAAPAPAASGEIEEIDRNTGESVNITRSESPSNSTTATANANAAPGVGPRTRGTAAPPSAFRGSRASISGPPLPPQAGGVASVPGSVGVPDDAHPLSPNPSEDPSSSSQIANGETSSVGHGSSNVNGVPAGAPAGTYAHQYPHMRDYGPVGYQYPPSPPPGAQQVYPGYPAPVPAPGTPTPYPPGLPQYPVYANGAPMSPTSPISPNGTPLLPNGMPMPSHGIGIAQGGYAVPTPRAPPLHNAFMANSAIARSSSAVDLVPYAARFNGIAGAGGPGGQSRRNSVDVVAGFAPPQPPFAQGAVAGYPPPSPRTPGTPELRHAGSLPRLREPFLSPTSRRSSSVWAPPTPAVYTASNLGYGDAGDGRTSGFYAYNGVGSGSNTMLALPGKKEPFPSSALRRKISVSEKPWIKNRQKGERAAWWLTFCIMWIGVAVGAVVVFFGFMGVRKIDENLCSVLDEDFSSFNTDTWAKNISLGGFGNGEFQMTTDSSDNLYIKNGQLYIMPTLTSDEIGTDSIFNGYSYNLTGCTESWNASACSVRSNEGTNTVVNPVKSARISTKDSVSIAYGKVEVVAKMPRGDWLWPAIWMLPRDEKYGAWPRSGEIDIVEARGNQPSYPRQGNNFVRSSLNWGPLDTVLANAFGWQSQKRSTYAAGFHTYTLEWTPDFMRISVDSRLRAMLDLNIAKKSFWERGNFPGTAQNGSTEAVVQDIWEGQPNAAPFDQEFYLIISLSVGGTSGWFPDNVGDKMWFDGSATAMTDFAKAQDEWYSTWPSSDDDRALRVDSVKMWKLC